MSRAALRVQEGNAKEREERAEEIFATACEEGRRRPNALPLWGPDTSFHFNPVLLRNTVQSPYFQKCCQSLKDWNAVIDEIYYEVNNLLVMGPQQQPSTAFCLLLRLLTLRMTPHQLDLTLSHADSPYIRAIGFLYLRFAGPPERLWELIAPYVHDEELVAIEKAATAREITMGEFVRELFQSREYCKGATTLPRLPIQVERELQVKLLEADQIAERAKQNFKNARRMDAFTKIGAKVMALYGDEENPVTWYEAEVDRVIPPVRQGGHPKFVVTFPEYGNTETVGLGELDVLESDRAKYPQNDNNRDKLYQEVQRRERDRVAASDKGSWARRPPSTKQSLTSSSNDPHRRGYGGGKARYRDDHYRPRSRSRENDSYQHQPKLPPAAASPHLHAGTESRAAAAPPPKKRTNEEMAAIAEKKRKLMAKYG